MRSAGQCLARARPGGVGRWGLRDRPRPLRDCVVREEAVADQPEEVGTDLHGPPAAEKHERERRAAEVES